MESSVCVRADYLVVDEEPVLEEEDAGAEEGAAFVEAEELPAVLPESVLADGLDSVAEDLLSLLVLPETPALLPLLA